MQPPDMTGAALADDRDLELSDRDFSRIAQLVHDIAGIVLAQAKRPLVHSRLMRRLRALKLHDFAAYAEYVSVDANSAERLELISAVTTNVTSFFREKHHFETLAAKIVPDLIAKAHAGGRIRIWSAGCSSGEEPYSIAATLLAAWPDAHQYDVRILATDIDHMMIEKTRRGIYPIDAREGIAADLSSRLFGDQRSPDGLRISDAAKGLVICNALNLQEKWPMRGQFDVIFCRNVVIYFDKATQERLWQRFSEILLPGGYLMIGHAERLTGVALSDFSPDGITTYKRRG
jgi:chemotaxis protein methyltransferase CheR